MFYDVRHDCAILSIYATGVYSTPSPFQIKGKRCYTTFTFFHFFHPFFSLLFLFFFPRASQYYHANFPNIDEPYMRFYDANLHLHLHICIWSHAELLIFEIELILPNAERLLLHAKRNVNENENMKNDLK